MDVEVEALAEDVLAQEALLGTPRHRFLHHAEAAAVLVTQVDVGDPGARGIGGDDDAFEKLVRVFLDEDAVC